MHTTALGSANMTKEMVFALATGLVLGLIAGMGFMLPVLIVTKFPGRAYPAWERVRDGHILCTSCTAVAFITLIALTAVV